MSGTPSGEFTGTNYGPVADLYPRLEWFLGGVLERTRNAFLGSLPFSPKNPLVVGCGPGAFPAAFVRSENPDRLTINDIAHPMLLHARKRLACTEWGGELTVREGDVARLEPAAPYDFVAAQFLLDCFPQTSRVRLLERLKDSMEPGSVLLVSGYARPQARWMLPLFYLNFGAALLCFWVLGSNQLVRPGDMERAILDSGFRILQKRTCWFGLFASWLVHLK